MHFNQSFELKIIFDTMSQYFPLSIRVDIDDYFRNRSTSQ